jgi:hypothetical protein
MAFKLEDFDFDTAQGRSSEPDLLPVLIKEVTWVGTEPNKGVTDSHPSWWKRYRQLIVITLIILVGLAFLIQSKSSRPSGLGVGKEGENRPSGLGVYLLRDGKEGEKVTLGMLGYNPGSIQPEQLEHSCFVHDMPKGEFVTAQDVGSCPN